MLAVHSCEEIQHRLVKYLRLVHITGVARIRNRDLLRLWNLCGHVICRSQEVLIFGAHDDERRHLDIREAQNDAAIPLSEHAPGGQGKAVCISMLDLASFLAQLFQRSQTFSIEAISRFASILVPLLAGFVAFESWASI